MDQRRNFESMRKAKNNSTHNLANCTTDFCHNGGSCVENLGGSDQQQQICYCTPGFQGTTCQYDVNECVVENGQCQHECVNGQNVESDKRFIIVLVIGSFYCRCYPGYELEEKGGKKCIGENHDELEQTINTYIFRRQ